jgi:regulator of replication initiation timing
MDKPKNYTEACEMAIKILKEDLKKISDELSLTQQLRDRVSKLENDLIAAHKDNSDLKESLSKWREATCCFTSLESKRKIQGLISENARLKMEGDIIYDLLDRDYDGMSADYETLLTERVKDFIKAVDEQVEVIEKYSSIDNIRNKITPHLAELRHLYHLMILRYVKNPEQAAKDLLSPAIAGIEKVITYDDKSKTSN